MRNSFYITIFFTILFLLPVSNQAQNLSAKIHPALQEVLNNAQEDELINVYAIFKDRLDYNYFNDRTAGMSKDGKRNFVTSSLKEHAAATQSMVLNFLNGDNINGKVQNIQKIWAINTLSFQAAPSIIYQLAENYDEIESIHYDPVIPFEQLTDNKTNRISDQTGKGSKNNPELAPQQGLVLINAVNVWPEGDSGKGVIVANMDTGCDWDHPDLVNNMWNNLGEDADGDGHTLEYNGSTWQFDPGDQNGIDDDGNGKVDDFYGWDFAGNDNNPQDFNGHGTKTSGIVAGDGTGGTQTGVAPRAKLMILRPSGESQFWLASQYAVDNGADVITSSLSYKWYFSPQPNYPMFREITDIELAAGVIHSNSTSNDGNNLGSAPIPYNISAPGNSPTSWIHPDQDPGGLSSVIGVGNVGAFSDVIQSSSPHGPAAWEDIQANHPGYPYSMPLMYQDYPYETQSGAMGLLKPDVSAPGNNTTSTSNGGGYGSFSGTSGATPHVAGTIALMLEANPFLTPSDVSRILQTTAIEKGAPGKDSRYGAGRIDAFDAWQQAVDELIPVELTSFTADVSENGIVLNWITATELNNKVFEIYRRQSSDVKGQSDNWKRIGSVDGKGTTTQPQVYSFVDEEIKSGKYLYRLKQIDYDGQFEFSHTVEAEVLLPAEFSLEQNYPNPFNPATTIEYRIAETGFVNLKVFDILGNEVATLINEEKEQGVYKIEFDASKISSGIYYYRLSAGEFTSTKKMILLK